ncbi:hypothetical protein J6590_089228, partial [Homalodisca vitripennis]
GLYNPEVSHSHNTYSNSPSENECLTVTFYKVGRATHHKVGLNSETVLQYSLLYAFAVT